MTSEGAGEPNSLQNCKAYGSTPWLVFYITRCFLTEGRFSLRAECKVKREIDYNTKTDAYVLGDFSTSPEKFMRLNVGLIFRM